MAIRKLSLATAALFVIPGLSQAEFNYTAVEIAFVDVEVEVGPFNVDGDGFGVAGTVQVADSFFIGAGYQDYDFDFGIDGDALEIGGGYFHPINDDLDFVATFSFLDTEVSAGNSSADDDGLALGGGIRARVADAVEVEAMLEFVDMDAGDSDTGIELGGRYYVSDTFAVGARAGFGNDFETIAIGVRFEF